MAEAEPDNVLELRGKLAGIALGPAMQALRSDRERLFCFAYGSGIAQTYAEAGRLAGYKPENARQLAHQLQVRGGARITKAIQEVARERFHRLVPRVITAAEKVLDDPKHKHHVPLIISLLGRMGYSEKTQVDVNMEIKVEDHTRAAVDDLRRMKAMGLSHEKLVEAFGVNGLPRYEKLLAAETKTIEHMPAAGAVEQPHNPMEKTLGQDEPSAVGGSAPAGEGGQQA